MAFPLIFMPSTIIGSLALVLVPELSTDYYSHNFPHLKSNIEKALKFSCLVACIIIPVFLSFGEQIGEFLYSSKDAGKYIVKGAIMMLPMSLSMISTSMLNSLNKEKRTLASYFVGASVMILSIIFLPAILGIDALTVGMLLNFTLSAIINLIMLYKTSPEKIEFLKYLFVSAMTVIPTATFGVFLKNLLILKTNLTVSTIAGVFVTAVFSFLLFWIFGLFDFLESKIKPFKKGHSLKYGDDDKNKRVINNAN